MDYDILWYIMDYDWQGEMMVRMEGISGNPSSLAANESPIFPSRSIQEAGDHGDQDKYEVTMASWDGVRSSQL